MQQAVFTAGAGFKYSLLSIDYGFSPHNDLGSTHRISLSVQMQQN
jgi:hypothetical protein